MIRALTVAALSLSLGAAPARRNAVASMALTVSQPSVDPQATANGTTYTASALPGALNLAGCSGFRLTVVAPVGCTLAGAGTLDVYYWPPSLSVSSPSQFYQGAQPWPVNTSLQQTLSAAVSSTKCAGNACRSATFGDFPTYGANSGWVYAAPNGITMNGGCASVLVLTEANCSQ